MCALLFEWANAVCLLITLITLALIQRTVFELPFYLELGAKKFHEQKTAGPLF